jgi:ABC-2 type transport system permease protein
MNRRKFRLTFALAAVLLAAGAVLLISVLDNMTGARVDMTSDKLFTMSPAAASILEGLKVPVQIKLYISPAEKRPTQFRDLERDITEQLRNFEQVSNNMLKFTVFNPQEDEEMQKMLATKGIDSFPVQSIDKDEVGIKRIWSAMTISYKDKPEETIKMVQPNYLMALEQVIIGPIYRLTRARDPKVAIYAPPPPLDPMQAAQYMQQGMQPPPPAEIYSNLPKLLEQGHYDFEVIELTEQSPIPADADLLIVMATSLLNPRQVFEINQALSGGMSVILATATHEYAYNASPQGRLNISSINTETGLTPMLQQFGLQLMEDHFLDANMETLVLGNIYRVKVPVQIKVTETQMNQDNPISNRVASVLAQGANPIVHDQNRLADLGLVFTPLMYSSDNCWNAPFTPGVLQPAVVDQSDKPMLGKMPLGVLMEGQFPQVFQGQPAPTWPDAQPTVEPGMGPVPYESLEPAPLNPQPGKLVLFGSARMFDDFFLGRNQNALLLVNAVDYLAGSKELLAIRSKTMTQRVIRPVESGEKLAWRFFATIFVPILLAIFGLVRVGMRRKEAALYRQQVTGGFRP